MGLFELAGCFVFRGRRDLAGRARPPREVLLRDAFAPFDLRALGISRSIDGERPDLNPFRIFRVYRAPAAALASICTKRRGISSNVLGNAGDSYWLLRRGVMSAEFSGPALAARALIDRIG
jgi:hypothetical protein